MAVAGGPTGYSDYAALAAASLDRPIVRLVQQAAQSIANTADVAITFAAGSEEIDTHGFHDTATNTSRITPTRPGYYDLRGNVWWAADTDLVSFHSAIGKNGSVTARNRIVLPSTATASASRSHQVVATLQANGSTDYFELIGQQTQAATGSLSTSVAGSFSSTFECIFLRPL